MKSIFTAILSILVLGTQAQTLILSDPIQVADNELYGKTRPRVAVNRSGEPVVMWGQNATKKVFVSSLGAGSGQFGTPVDINPNGIQAFISNWVGPDIGSYGDTVFVTYHSTPENIGFSYVHKSVDGGLTFGDSVRVDHPTVEQSRFPSVTVQPNGNPVVGFMQFEGNYLDPRYVVANSNDGGASFLEQVEASLEAPGEVCDCCPAQVITNGDKQAIAYRNNDENLRDAWVSISSDNGATFPIVEDIDNGNWMINACPSSGPDGFMSGDTLYTTWMSEGSGDARISIASISMLDGGIGHSNFVRNQPFDGIVENYPRMAGENDNIGIVFQGWTSGNYDCFVTASTTGISGLGDTLRLGATTDGAQRYPDIAFHNGVFHIVYDDSEAGHLMYQTAFWGNVGIDEFELEPKVWVNQYGQIQIDQVEAGSTVEVFNMLGESVHHSSLKGSSEPISGLPQGTYLLRISNGKDQFIKKMIVP